MILTLILAGIFATSCQEEEQQPKDTTTLLTAHKWQLVEESGLNLPKESLGDNIIELKNDGGLVYYEQEDDTENVFQENKWTLSDDEKKIIEILPDDSKNESEIVEINDKTLKIRYTEANPGGELMTVIETYRKFTKQ